MSDNHKEIVEAVFRTAIQAGTLQTRPPGTDEPKGIHYSELQPSSPGDTFFDEWNTYCQNVGGWLANGLEGQFVLIRGKEVIGFYPDWKSARQAGLDRFLLQLHFIHEIRTHEPVWRIRGINMPCPR